jgi:hypothetical protein|tara:strand:+ start:489 stop:743 length:255 start_codon:yes stop_codon:yes gene_type:complete
MRRIYVIKRFILGICAILVVGGMLWLNYMVLIDRLSVGLLWVDIPAILILVKISNDMDQASALIAFLDILEKENKEDNQEINKL